MHGRFSTALKANLTFAFREITKNLTNKYKKNIKQCNKNKTN